MQNLPPQLTGQSQLPMDMQSMGNGILAGYDQTTDTEDEPQKILAHFAPDELPELDEMQGGILIDPETNLREYTPLDKILRNPEIRQAILEAIEKDRQSQGIQGFAMGGEVEPGRPTDPELEKLRLEGRKGDTELVIITPELLEIFSEWRGKEPDINPVTGLPEFGWFQSIIRIAAPVVGAIFGGPAGAALAGGLATKLTGGSWMKSLGAGALSGLGAFAAPALGGMVQNSFPGLSNALGGATRGLLGENVVGALGRLFTPAPGGGSVAGLNTVGRMIPGAAGQASSQGLGQVGMQSAGQTGGGLLSSIISKGLPLIGSGLLMAKGHQQEQKGLREYQQSLENRENRDRQEQEGLREKYGYNAKLNPVKPFQWKPTNDQPTRKEMERGITRRNFDYDLAAPYAQGGAIRGIGKGQQDNIHKNIKENSYIIDASTVSDLGDGSTNAGMHELDKFLSRLPSNQFNSNRISHQASGGYIKAMVSDGEYEVSPEQVTALGGGSNEKGAKILKKLVEEIRAKKRTSGERLPPKSKPIGGYIKGLQRTAA